MNYALGSILVITAAIAVPSAAQTETDADCSTSATAATGYTPPRARALTAVALQARRKALPLARPSARSRTTNMAPAPAR